MSPRRQNSRIAGILILALALGILDRPAWGADRCARPGTPQRPSPHTQRGLVSKPLLLGFGALAILGLTKCMPLADQQANPKDWLPDGCTVSFPLYGIEAQHQIGAWAKGKIIVSVPAMDAHLVSLGETGIGAGHPAAKPGAVAAVAQDTLGRMTQLSWHPIEGSFLSLKSGKDLKWPGGGCSGARESYGKHAWDAAKWGAGQVGDLLGWVVEGMTTTASPNKK